MHACFSGGHAARPECSTREPRGDVIADGSEVIRGHQRSSKVNQRSSEVNQRSSEVISGDAIADGQRFGRRQ